MAVNLGFARAGIIAMATNPETIATLVERSSYTC